MKQVFRITPVTALALASAEFLWKWRPQEQ